MTLFDDFQNLFDEEPEEDTRHLSRTGDPETSHEAAALVTDRAALKDRIESYVSAHAGVVRGEIADGLEEPQEKVWRRLSECVNEGRVVYLKPGRLYKGRRQQTCWPPGHPEIKTGEIE